LLLRHVIHEIDIIIVIVRDELKRRIGIADEMLKELSIQMRK